MKYFTCTCKGSKHGKTGCSGASLTGALLENGLCVWCVDNCREFERMRRAPHPSMCGVCDLTFTSRAELDEHVRFHDRQVPRESGGSIPERGGLLRPESPGFSWPAGAEPPVLNKSGGSDVEGK